MAKKKTTAEYPRLVEKVYIHGDIKVGVRIDYRQKRITLTDQDGNGRKQWVFAERGVEYMEGWRQILAAMEYAITAAEAELRQYIEAEEAEKAKLAEAVMRNKD